MEQEIYYIVGVATKEKYRHRGYMDRILKAALSFIRKKEQPFAFLMPANPNIYLPYQFTYIYDKEGIRMGYGDKYSMETASSPICRQNAWFFLAFSSK